MPLDSNRFDQVLDWNSELLCDFPGLAYTFIAFIICCWDISSAALWLTKAAHSCRDCKNNLVSGLHDMPIQAVGNVCIRFVWQ